jgi:hypothetical protein
VRLAQLEGLLRAVLGAGLHEVELAVVSYRNPRSPDTAAADPKRIATLLCAALLLFCGWRGRQSLWRRAGSRLGGRIQRGPDSHPFAVAGTWTQHMVLMLPALYLITADQLGSETAGRAVPVAVAVYVLFSLVLIAKSWDARATLRC